MKRPAPLSPGDTIALAAPSRFATLDQVQEITRLLESRGYKVHIDEDVLARDFQFAGTDKQRAEVFNRLIHNNEIKAIWCMRGGYGGRQTFTSPRFLIFGQPPQVGHRL